MGFQILPSVRLLACCAVFLSVFFFKCCAVVKLVGEGAHAYGMACPCEFYVLLCVLLVCVLFWLRALLLCLMCCPLLSCVYGLPGSQCLPAFVLLCVLCCAFFFLSCLVLQFCVVSCFSFCVSSAVSCPLPVSAVACCVLLGLLLFRAAFLRLLCLCACCLLVDVCVCCCAYCLCVRLWFVLCVCFAFPALGVWQMWARTRPLGELLGCTSLYLKKKKRRFAV